MILNIGGKTRIYTEKNDESAFLTRPDFMLSEEHNRIKIEDDKGREKVHSVADMWLKWKHRKQYRTVTFLPCRDTPADVLNLWTGWAVQPVKGSWELLQDLIENTLCDRDEPTYSYVYKWLAWMVQNPHLPAEVALAFHGDKGTGKGTLGTWIMKMIGRHGVHLYSPTHLTGRFNRHLMDKIFIFADEAVRPSDKAASGVLKGMITEKSTLIEPKGIDAMIRPSCLHIMIASNDNWFLDMTPGQYERRYVVSRVAENRIGDTDFFDELEFEMDVCGGVQAMLHDLLTMPLGVWHPRMDKPKGEAYTEQLIMNLPVMAQWLHARLSDRKLPDAPATEWMGQIAGDRPQIEKSEVIDDFKTFCYEHRYNWAAGGRSSPVVFSRELFRTIKGDDGIKPRRLRDEKRGRRQYYEFPPLESAREGFCHTNGLEGYVWDEE